MVAAQLLLTHSPADQVITFHAQVETGQPHGWVTVSQWTASTPSRLQAKARAELIRAESAAHGWEPTTQDWAKDADGRYVVPVRPADWRTVLTAATEQRAVQLAAYEAADLAWRVLVADTPRQGEPGYVGAIDIADMAGLTRYRVYQIQGVGKTPGYHPTPRP
jgi:hypothetical protein